MAGAENLLSHLVRLPPLRGGEQKQILRLDVSVDEVPLPQELEGTGELLQKVTSNNLIKARARNCRVLASDVVRRGIRDQPLSLLNEQSEVAKFAVLHHNIDVRG